MAHIVCLSDFHLGDAGCALKNQAAASSLADYLAQVTNKSIDTLVLNGDIWEQCIPVHTGQNPERGFFRSVASASQQVFGAILGQIAVKRMVWVPGNHDFTLFKRLAHSRNLSSLYTLPIGLPITAHDNSVTKDFFEVLLPAQAQSCEFRLAYPNFASRMQFPYILFTHGHLFDPFVLGWNDDAKSRALYLMGLSKAIDQDIESMEELAEQTAPFMPVVWGEDSQLGYVYWNYINRRLDHSQSCSLAGTKSQKISSDVEPTSPRDGFLPKVPWYLNLAVTDKDLPSPVGDLRSPQAPKDFKTPSCFVFGHDHLGSRSKVIVCGVPFAVRDSAGWTVEHEGHHAHTHFLLWPTSSSCIPESHFVQV